MTREEYLSETKAWKRDYKNLSNKIREIKANMRSKRLYDQGLPEWKERATSMMEYRKELKQTARNSYLEMKQS